MGQLVPGAGEGVRELVRVLQEAPGDRLVDRVEAQRQVGGQHDRDVPLARVVGVRDGALAGAVLRLPLVGAGRALGELPLVAEQGLEEAVVPGDRGGRPGALQAAGDRVGADAGAEGALPAEALLLDRGGLRVRADVVGRAGAVGLAEGVAAGDQRDGLLVVHRHPVEGLADVAGGGDRVRVAVGALGVDVDEAHLDGGQRVLQLAVAGVALVAQPGGLRAPVDVLVRLPLVDPAAAEPEGAEAHALQGDVAGQDDQVGPGQAATVLLLHRPQQAAGLVQAGVVGPAVQRGEALLAAAGAAAAVADPVGAGAVPGHPDHERAVVAVVGRPPVLGAGEDLLDVPLDGGEVERVEGRRVVEVRSERIGHGGVLGKDLQVEPFRPPLAVPAALGGVRRTPVVHRAALRLRLYAGCIVDVRHGNPSLTRRITVSSLATFGTCWCCLEPRATCCCCVLQQREPRAAATQASAGADPTMDAIQVKKDTKPISDRDPDATGCVLVNSGPPLDLNR